MLIVISIGGDEFPGVSLARRLFKVSSVQLYGRPLRGFGGLPFCSSTEL